MAGLLETYLQDIRVDYPNLLDRDEWRDVRFGLVNSAIEQTNSPLSVLDMDTKEKALDSEGRNLDVPVVKKGTLTVKNTRSCDFTEQNNESELVRIVWKTVAVDIFMNKAQYAKNHVGYNADLAKKLVLAKEALLSEVESDIYTKLDTDKSQVYNSSLVGGKYAFVGNSVRVTPTQQQLFYNDLNSINHSDDFYFDPCILASTAHMPPVEHYINQGSGNDENLTYQFAGKTFKFTNNIVDGAGVASTAFVMQMGSLGLLTRVPIDCRMGNTSTDGHSWSTSRVDGIPFDVGVMHSSTCSDQSALNGSGLEHLTATMVEHWQISFDFAVVTPYNSDPASNPGAIRKVEFLS